jgi:hypothetical protein
MRAFRMIILYVFANISLYALYMTLAQTDTIRQKSKITETELYNDFFDFIAKVKPYGFPLDREEFIKVAKPEIKQYDRLHDLTMTDGYTMITSQIASKILSVVFDTKTGDIKRFALLFLGEDDDTPIKPKLTEEEALKKIRDFPLLKRDIDLSKHKVIISYKINRWSLLVVRTTKDLLYLEDRISIDYSEKYGFLSYYNRFFSDECDTEPKLKKEEAEKIAETSLLRIKKNGLIKQPEKVDTRMQIVNQILLQETQSLKKSSLSELRKSRIAWIIVYAERAKDAEKVIVIIFYIDALSGEIIFVDYLAQE